MEQKRTIKAFVPSKLEAIILPVSALVFLSLTYGLSLFRKADGESYILVIEYLETHARALLQWLDEAVGATIPLMLFWMIVGTVVYVIGWILYVIAATYRSDIVQTKNMIVPKDYSRRKAWHESLARLLTRVISGALLALWLYLLFSEVLPFAYLTFHASAAQLSLWSIAEALLATILVSAWIFVAAVLSRCIVLRDRVFT